MLTIKILGPNTPHTKQAEAHTRTALRWLQPHDGYDLVTICEPSAFGTFVTGTPAVMINDEVVCEGHVPAVTEVVTWASEAMQTQLELD